MEQRWPSPHLPPKVGMYPLEYLHRWGAHFLSREVYRFLNRHKCYKILSTIRLTSDTSIMVI